VSVPTGSAVTASRGRRPKWAFVVAGLALLRGVGLTSLFAGRGVGQSRGERDVKFKPLTYRSLPIFRAPRLRVLHRHRTRRGWDGASQDQRHTSMQTSKGT
jgi:hypothetical protein